MTLTTEGKRRPAAAMLGHALALSFKQSKQDRRDGDAMRSYLGLRAAPVKLAARMAILAGIVGRS